MVRSEPLGIDVYSVLRERLGMFSPYFPLKLSARVLATISIEEIARRACAGETSTWINSNGDHLLWTCPANKTIWFNSVDIRIESGTYNLDELELHKAETSVDHRIGASTFPLSGLDFQVESGDHVVINVSGHSVSGNLKFSYWGREISLIRSV